MKYCCKEMDEAEDSWMMGIINGEELRGSNEKELFLISSHGFEEKMKLNYCPFCGNKLNEKD